MIANHIALPKPLDFILYHVFLYTFWVEGIYFQRKIHKFIPKALDLRIFDILTSWAFRIYGSFLRKMPSVYLDFRKAWSAKWSPIMIVIWSLRILTKWSWVIVDHIMVKVSWVIVDHEKCDRTLLWIFIYTAAQESIAHHVRPIQTFGPKIVHTMNHKNEKFYLAKSSLIREDVRNLRLV